MEPGAQSLVLVHVRDERGLMHREVQAVVGGGLTIIGHDLGPGVDVLGGEEYEFERTVDAEGVRRLVDALGGGRPVLELVQERFTSTHDLEVFLEEQGIPSRFWSRVG